MPCLGTGGDSIPKAKPSNVQVVRFELQEKERELLESALVTWQAKSFVGGITKSITSLDLPTLYALVTILEVVTGKEILPGTPNDLLGLMDDLRDWLKGGGLDDFFPGPVNPVSREQEEGLTGMYTNEQTGPAPESVAEVYARAYGVDVNG